MLISIKRYTKIPIFIVTEVNQNTGLTPLYSFWAVSEFKVSTTTVLMHCGPVFRLQVPIRFFSSLHVSRWDLAPFRPGHIVDQLLTDCCGNDVGAEALFSPCRLWCHTIATEAIFVDIGTYCNWYPWASLECATKLTQHFVFAKTSERRSHPALVVYVCHIIETAAHVALHALELGLNWAIFTHTYAFPPLATDCCFLLLLSSSCYSSAPSMVLSDQVHWILRLA